MRIVERKKRNPILTFVISFASVIFGLPLLYALGVPSGDVVLTALFGEGNIWTLIFSAMLILLITFGVGRAIKSST
ncbi:hypothetical protein BJ095_11180 [Ureibacillus chungkukjangi]|uniref:Uncharacterized protein n=1 Tax=Ureibacillus chungkukjangi TaxID=1202712 RepID=A0A318U2V0_9BACL|nr:hypothetical protein BJ095_11180 [Ureibacillus chungkukjangi]